MPQTSPFPGMDPYLEQARLWPGLHDSLITYLRDDLQRMLPEAYYADVQERIYLQEAGHWIVPDVRVTEVAVPVREAQAPRGDRGTMPVVIEVPDLEIREPYIEIRDTRSGDVLVTVIEVLSPDNKRGQGEGAEQYRAKQRELLRSRTNLVEIDLLRGGNHTVAVPPQRLESVRPYSYLVVVRLGARPVRREVYPIGLRAKLPEVQVPLREPDPAATVDLQSLFERAYAGGAYWKRINYDGEPEPPLSTGDQAWARELIAGSRGG